MSSDCGLRHQSPTGTQRKVPLSKSQKSELIPKSSLPSPRLHGPSLSRPLETQISVSRKLLVSMTKEEASHKSAADLSESKILNLTQSIPPSCPQSHEPTVPPLESMAAMGISPRQRGGRGLDHRSGSGQRLNAATATYKGLP